MWCCGSMLGGAATRVPGAPPSCRTLVGIVSARVDVGHGPATRGLPHQEALPPDGQRKTTHTQSKTKRESNGGENLQM